ncbi:MAG: hydrogenase maturation nickel metallochaperone HypA [Marinifilaceae bacterium]
MHEFSIINNIIQTITEIAEQEKLCRITRITLVIGKMRRIVPSILEYAFRISSKDTLAENAEICIESIPIKMQCKDCNHISEIIDDLYICLACGGTGLQLHSGKELYIKSIDGEQKEDQKQ